MKRPRLPGSYLLIIAAGILGCVVLPYGDELVRCVRARPSRRSSKRLQ